MSDSSVTDDRQEPKLMAILTDAERARLHTLISKASREAFPPPPRLSRGGIGESPQRDFYFRRLLDRLLENTLHFALPATGGTYDELYAFTRSVESLWARGGKGRVGYSRRSMKALASHWKKSIALKRRSYTAYGTQVVFHYVSGSDHSDFILSASVTNFLLDNAKRISIPSILDRLPSRVRLSTPGLTESLPDEAGSRMRIITRLVRDFGGRAFSADYRRALAAQPMSKLEEHERETRDLKRRNKTAAIVASVALVIATLGFIAYRSYSAATFLPVISVKPDGTILIRDSRGVLGPRDGEIHTNRTGQVAIFNGQKQLTDWVDVLGNPDTGAYLRMRPGVAGQWIPDMSGAMLLADIDEVTGTWTGPTEPIAPTLRVRSLVKDNRHVWATVIIDRRLFWPLGGKQPNFHIDFGDDGKVYRDVAFPYVSWIPFLDGDHFMLQSDHKYRVDGTYRVSLVHEFTMGDEGTGRTTIAELASMAVSAGRPPEITRVKRTMPFKMLTIKITVIGDQPQLVISNAMFENNMIYVAFVPDTSKWPKYISTANVAYSICVENSLSRNCVQSENGPLTVGEPKSRLFRSQFAQFRLLAGDYNLSLWGKAGARLYPLSANVRIRVSKRARPIVLSADAGIQASVGPKATYALQ
jgi:hypothetical protein